MFINYRWLLGFFVLVAGCSEPPAVPTSGNGELHQGNFTYEGAAGLPSGIAVDADFALRYDAATGETISLEPSASFFSVDAAGRFHAKRAGYGVVLVTNDKGSVVDFVNLRVKTIASLAITGLPTATSLVVGETRTISASAFDAAGEALAGTLSLEWESSDEAVATVTSIGELHAVAAGTTRIRVTAGNTTSTVSVQVGGS